MQTDESIEGGSSADSAADLQLVEQPGGRVLHVDGTPFGVSSLEEVMRDSFAQLATFYPWLAPLLVAAIVGGKDDEGGERRASVMTPWGDEREAEYTDADQHLAYADHVKAAIVERQPWFWSLLDNARATVMLAPAGFTFALPTHPGAQFDIPDFLPLLALESVCHAGATKH